MVRSIRRLSEEDEEYIKEYHYVEWDSKYKEYFCYACHFYECKEDILNHIQRIEHNDNSIYKTFFNNFNSTFFLKEENSTYHCKECDETYNFNSLDGLEYNLKKIEKHFDTHKHHEEEIRKVMNITKRHEELLCNIFNVK
jgi:hypothetical protein